MAAVSTRVTQIEMDNSSVDQSFHKFPYIDEISQKTNQNFKEVHILMVH